MLLHVIWGFVEQATRECPTFSVTGVLLPFGDRSSAHVRQGRFHWRDDAWEAELEISSSGVSRAQIRGILRLHPEVLETWLARSLNPRREAARQLREALERQGLNGNLGILTLRES